jgi:hypothetical protein
MSDFITFDIYVNINTGCFIMFCVITIIYNKNTKGPTLMVLFTASGKLKKFFWQLEIFVVSTTGDTAHIDTILNFLPHTGQHECIDIPHCCNDSQWSLQQWRISMHPCWRMCGKKFNIVSMWAVSPVVHTSKISSCQKQFFQFFCGCEHSIKVGLFVFLL